MITTQWAGEPFPFGNAGPFDLVATDVAAEIARRFGAAVTVGSLPERMGLEEGERQGPLAKVITIGRGGVTAHISRHERMDGHEGHDWTRLLGPDTVVIDSTVIGEDDIVRYAVSGPMIDPDLSPGTVAKLALVEKAGLALGLSHEEMLRDVLPGDWAGDDSTLTCPHGHVIEHDGACPQGCVSPLRQMGLI